MKRLFLLSFALIGAKSAFAQIITVPVITTDTTKVERVIEIDDSKYNRISLSYASYGYFAGRAHGFVAEYIHDWSIDKSHPLFLESGLIAQFNADSYGDYYVDFSIPVNLTYRYSLNNNAYVAPFAGLNIGVIAIDDWILWQYSDKKRFHFGYNIGANFSYKRLNIGIGYSRDFTPMLADTFHVGLGVNF